MLTMRQLITCTRKKKINHSQKHSCAVLATTSPKLSTSLSQGMSARGFEAGQRHSLGKVHLQKLYFNTETPLLRYFPPAVKKGCGNDGCVGCSCDGFSPCASSAQLCETHLWAPQPMLSIGFSEKKSFPLTAPVSTAVPFKGLGRNIAAWNIQTEPSN